MSPSSIVGSSFKSRASGGGKLDEDDGIVQFRIEDRCRGHPVLSGGLRPLADHVLFGQAERRIHSRAFARISVVGA